MIAYVDSSVVLRWLLRGEDTLARAARDRTAGSSELLLIECSRVIERLRLSKTIDDEEVAAAREALRDAHAGISIIPLSAAVKRRAAGSFPTVIGTLDAMHLATALLWAEQSGEPLALYTHDRQLGICARALGFEVPLE